MYFHTGNTIRIYFEIIFDTLHYHFLFLAMIGFHCHTQGYMYCATCLLPLSLCGCDMMYMYIVTVPSKGPCPQVYFYVIQRIPLL